MIDQYAYEYFRRNTEVGKDVSVRKEQKQYDDLKAELQDEFQRELRNIDFPTTDAKIDSVFVRILKDILDEFMS